MERATDDWFESESFWVEMFPFMFPETRFAAAVENAPKIASLTGVAGGTLLDLACGPGRYAIPLAQAGYRVTGVDRTQFLLDAARERAARAGAEIEWIEADMRDFARPAAFDLAISMFTSFGYFDDPAENRRVLTNVRTSLKPGGVFLLDHLGKELLAARFQPTRSESLPDGTLLVCRQTVIDDWSRIDSEWIRISAGRGPDFGELSRGAPVPSAGANAAAAAQEGCGASHLEKDVSRFHLRHWLYSGWEMRQLLTEAGFASVQLYGDLDGAPYGPEAQRLIAVARKS